MYAVIRAGGKQYRVSPGDVIKIEKESGAENIDFEVLAVSGEEGKIVKADDAKVVGEVVGEGRADKILVFHFKRKKQYKKLNGHRQPFTQVRISEISFGGQSFKAPAAVKA
jgi:large subunit ribosomal protein L21